MPTKKKPSPKISPTAAKKPATKTRPAAKPAKIAPAAKPARTPAAKPAKAPPAKPAKKAPPAKPAKNAPPAKPAKKAPPAKPAKKAPPAKPAKKAPPAKLAKKAPPAKPAKKAPAAKKKGGTGESITQLVTLPAAPAAVWDALADPKRHGELTGAPATGKPVVGGGFTAWDGYIEGTYLALRKPERISMTWRTSDFPKSAKASVVELTLTASDEGTLLLLEQSDVPKGQAAGYDEGWVEYYWKPLRRYLAAAK